MTKYDQIWPNMTKYDQIWPNMTKYDQIWPNMTKKSLNHAVGSELYIFDIIQLRRLMWYDWAPISAGRFYIIRLLSVNTPDYINT